MILRASTLRDLVKINDLIDERPRVVSVTVDVGHFCYFNAETDALKNCLLRGS